MIKLHQHLQNQRKHLSLSQMELAKLAGVTQAMVSKLESGKDIRLSTLISITKALQLELFAIPPELSFQVKNALNPHKQKSLLEQFQVKDDE